MSTEQQWRAPIDGVYASPDGSTHALEAGDPAPQQQLSHIDRDGTRWEADGLNSVPQEANEQLPPRGRCTCGSADGKHPLDCLVWDHPSQRERLKVECARQREARQEALPPNPFDELKTRIVAIVDPLIADRDRLLEALAQIEQQAAHEHYGHATNGRNITAEQFKRIERIAERARLNPHQETTTT